MLYYQLIHSEGFTMLHDPVLTDLARYEHQVSMAAYEEAWREKMLADFRDNYIKDMDLADAVGTVDGGEALLNNAYWLMTHVDVELGANKLRELMEKGAEAYAQRQLDAEIKARQIWAEIDRLR